jgi:C-terminal peptidase prc
MANQPSKVLIHHIRRLVPAAAGGGTDRELLERFTRQGDETSFEDLIRRHGPMVLSVCRRVLCCRQDAEDVFQATFLVLVRQARRVCWQESVAGWLCRVAYHLALNLRTSELRRHRREERVRPRPVDDPLAAISGREFLTVLDEELAALPNRYRAPLVLCCLEGASSEDAARQLGCSMSTIKRRLGRGRGLLQARLARRGVVVSLAAVSAALLAEGAPAAVPGPLCAATCYNALLFAAAKLATGVGVGARAATLAERMLESMTMTKLKLTGLVVLLTVALTGPGLLVRQTVLAVAPAGIPAVSLNDLQLQQPPDPTPDRAPVSKPLHAVDGQREAARFDATAVARRAWSILDLVQQHHFKPCSRQEMLQSGMTAFLAQLKIPAAKDLNQRLANLASAPDLAVLLQQFSTRAAGKLSNKELQAGPAQWEKALLVGMLAPIPGRSNLLPAELLKITEQVSGNRYVGTGIQIRIHPKEMLPEIINPFRTGPARRAGVRPGDLLVEVDGKSTRGVDLQTVVRWLRGEEGTRVTFAVRQPGSSERRAMIITRGVVPFDNVLGYRQIAEGRWDHRVDPAAAIAYARISAINSSTLHELRTLEKRLEAEHDRALVLDLRFCTSDAGIHYGALVADGLLDGGLLWRWQDKQGQTKELRGDPDCLFRNWPLAVLINGETRDRSAGAVAAALQDNGRAVIVGEPAGADGFVSTVFPLPDGSGGITLPTGQLQRASGRGWPVKPDHEVPMTPAQREALAVWFRSQELPEPPAGAKAPNDSQLARAVEVLRAALPKSAADGK